MKRFISTRIISLCSIFLLFSTVLANAVWSPTQTPTNETTSFVIDGFGGQEVILPSNVGTSIIATLTDITVAIQNDPVITTSGISQLYVRANAGRKITFDMSSSSLTFKGSNNAQQTPLLILFGGSGTIEFLLGDGTTLSFTNDTAITRAGVKAFLYMGDPDINTISGTSRLQFKRAPNSVGNTTINVGPQSLLSYISNVPLSSSVSEIGNIEFCPTAATGNMVLNIQNTGAVIVSAQQVITPMLNTTQTDVATFVAHGGTAANFRVVSSNSAVTSRLLVTNSNNTLSNLEINPCCLTPNPFNGVLFGFVLSVNGTLDISDNSYLDYVGLTNNQCPPCGMSPSPCDFGPEALVKKRNASALIVDGSTDPNAVPARINFGTCSALFFRSGVNKDGVVEHPTAPNQFTVDPINRTPGEGETVFDVEGMVNVIGTPLVADGRLINVRSKLEILSLEVDPTGDPLFVDLCTPICNLIFPKRTFAMDVTGCFCLQYNAANFLVNNDLNLFQTALNHTDTIHEVFQKNDIKSEPTYIGGDSFICKGTCRPRIIFCNSRLLVHENIAFTGLDLLVPNCIQNTIDCCTCPPTAPGLQCTDNVSKFIFYYNGRCCDEGTGRTMILGTQIGSMNCSGCGIISRDAHLDVMQTDNCPTSLCLPGQCPSPLQQLLLQVDANSELINKCMHNLPTTCSAIRGQKSIHTIFLGHSSNITIGGHPNCCPEIGLPNSTTLLDTCLGSICEPLAFTCVTNPMFCICGNFFTFESRGGSKGLPALSNVTGEGGIFVDSNGKITINPDARASMNVMVTKSGNGLINLPRSQVLFGDQFGISDWNLTLGCSITTTNVIVPCGACLSDYTLNWLTTKKDCNGYCPYEPDSVTTCTCPSVLPCNVDCLPTIQGEVGQFQIQGSRLGDQAAIKVDGGYIRELIFERQGNYAGEAPVALVVVEGNGKVGLNTAHRSLDSTEAQVVLGVNGVTIVANGDGEIVLNEDVLVNNVCALLKGPNFSTARSGHILRFTSHVDREFRIKSCGILDLSTFATGDVIEFADNVHVVIEPGAIIRGPNLVDPNIPGPVIRLTGNVSWYHEPVLNPTACTPLFPLGAVDPLVAYIASTPACTLVNGVCTPLNPFDAITAAGNGLQNTDPYRVKYQGFLTLNLRNASAFYVPFGAYAGVETSPASTTPTPAAPNCCPSTGDCCVNNNCCSPITAVTISIEDSGLFMVGSLEPDANGGSFQVGDTAANTCGGVANSVYFNLNITGLDARAQTKSQSFLGLGVGIVDRRSGIPSEWLIDNLYNVNIVAINVVDGAFIHDRTFDTSDNRSSILAIGGKGSPVYNLFLENVYVEPNDRSNNSSILGGGNLVLVNEPGALGSNPAAIGAVRPIVLATDNFISLPDGFVYRVEPALLASRIMMENLAPINTIGGTLTTNASGLFQFIKVKDYRTVGNNNSRGTAANKGTEFRNSEEPIRAGYVDRGAIGRVDFWDVFDASGGTQQSRRQEAIDIGAVAVNINNDGPPGYLLSASNLAS